MPAADAPHFVRFGVFGFDPTAGDLWKAGHPTRLQEQPRIVLTMLLARPGELVTREELRAALWPGDTFVDFDTGLNVIVNKIRQALGDSASAPRFIETLPRRGYRFVAPVSIAERGTPEPTGRRRHTISLLALASALAVAALWWGWTRRADGRASEGLRIHSLAVLPLENLSGNAAEDYVADGVTEALTTDLASIRALRVISRRSTKRYKGSTKPIPTIARELAVDAVIEGSVLRMGNRIRLNVQLIDGRNDRHLWARAYERDLRDILLLQREAAEAVARQIEVAVTPGERTRLGHARPVDPVAHDAYMRGRYFLAGMAESEAHTARALEEFQRAIDLDPTYAPAYVGAAEAHQLRGTFPGGHPPTETRPLAFGAARRALDLDPELGDAYAILGRVQMSEFAWADAERSLARMLELAPGNAAGLVWYAYLLEIQGRFDDALEVARRAEALDPLDLNTRVRVGFVHTFARKYDEAVTRYREVLALDPHNVTARMFLVTANVQLGRIDEAIAVASDALARQGRLPLTLSHLAFAHGRAGHRSQARDLIDELRSISRREYVSPAHLALAYAGLGDRDRAFEWFERAYEERSNLMMLYPIEPMFEWRDDPRYTRLVSKIRQPHSVREPPATGRSSSRPGS